MAKVSVDIEYIKNSLHNIGYEISDSVVRENNGKNWQIKFYNSGAVVTIYDSNRTNNSVVNGRPDDFEKQKLKSIVDSLKSKEFVVDPLNRTIVELIRSHKEDDYYDFKQMPYKDNESLLHDILCLSNNTENRDAYLILGVADNFEVIGVDDGWESNYIFDFLKTQSFAGDHIPEVEVKELCYKCKRIVVIQCKASCNVPFYITKRYRGVNENQIYTRVGDTNTPKNKHASYSDVEKLWRVHFKKETE